MHLAAEKHIAPVQHEVNLAIESRLQSSQIIFIKIISPSAAPYLRSQRSVKAEMGIGQE
jgi:hypothetical protein